MKKVLITTIPFGDKNKLPLDLLEKNGCEYVINPLNKKLTESELVDLVGDFDIIIAGTEPITKKVMDKGKKLKLISRVGIGLDSVDLVAADRKGIKVSYTPDVPAPAVAELTIGLMLSLLRSVHLSNLRMHQGLWNRYFGRRLSEVKIGIIGAGRIGSRVLEHLTGFGKPQILVNDQIVKKDLESKYAITWAEKEEIYESCDIITLHLPLTKLTKNMIRKKHLNKMKHDAIIINTSRGGIINESDLFDVMKSGHLSGAAIDVFEQEPYAGNLRQIENCILTSHMGSMSVDCRTKMEIEAKEEVIRFLKGEPLEGLVPAAEYSVQSEGL